MDDSRKINCGISLEQALNKAFWIVKAPSMSVLLLPLVSFVLLTKFNYLPSMGYAGMKWAAVFFSVSFIGSWLVWSIQVPRWRLWAYRRVKDIRLLEQLAQQNQIIWESGSFFEKTELMTKQMKDEIKQLREASENSQG